MRQKPIEIAAPGLLTEVDRENTYLHKHLTDNGWRGGLVKARN